MIEMINITWPMGAIDPRIHCPACGASVLTPLEDEGPGCHHVQFIIDSESGEFNYVTEDFDQILEPFRKKETEEFGEWEATDAFIEESESDTFYIVSLVLAGESEEGEDSVCLRIGFELYFDEDQQELFDIMEKKHDEEGTHDHSQN